jgi:prolyl 4-hydroxylase
MTKGTGHVVLFLYILSIVVSIVVIVRMYKKPKATGNNGKIETNKAPHKGYTVREIPGFLTPEECASMIDLVRQEDSLVPSLVYGSEEDQLSKKKRDSMQAWVPDGRSALVDDISKRVAALTSTPVENQESLQVVRYTKGGFFTPHYDPCSLDKKGACKRMNGSAGPRMCTVLIYLNDDFEGGHTVFPKIGLSVRPETGKAVVFQGTDAKTGEIIRESLHGGEPVTSGEKWICNKWIRKYKFIN